MERVRNSSSVSSVLSMGQEGPLSVRSPPSPIQGWFDEKETLLAEFRKSNLTFASVSAIVKNFKETLFKYPDCKEIREEKAKYGLGPPELLYTDTPEDPRDVKAALWSCMLRGHCHKNKQTKVLIQVQSEEHLEVLEKKNFIKPGDDIPVFICAYHFMGTNEKSGCELSNVFLRHWFLNCTVPEGTRLKTSVRASNTRPRHISASLKVLWDLFEQGINYHDAAIIKMRGQKAS